MRSEVSQARARDAILRNRDRGGLNDRFGRLRALHRRTVFHPFAAGRASLSLAYPALFESTLIFHLTPKKDASRALPSFSSRFSPMCFYRTTLSFARRLAPRFRSLVAGKASFCDVSVPLKISCRG